MIKLISMLKRKPGTTHQEFLDYWFDVHGPLIKANSAAKYVRRYEQHPAAWPAEGSRQPEPDFPEVMADTAKFLDSSSLNFVLTEEPRIVIGD